ncbi:MAG: hypothetical protein H0X33_10125 [Taibaiella sp.]|nr:hypothetical protein [Taibaiella sp.]
MKLIKFILLLAILYIAMDATAQSPGTQKPTGKINLADANGYPDGTWLLTTKAKMGEPGMNEFGSYEHGRKTGKWCKMDAEGNLVSMETYQNNMLDGEVKYYEEGRLSCIGHYRRAGGKTLCDTVIVTDPETGLESIKYAPRERNSQKHGQWRFYDPETKRLIKEQEYQVDNLIYEKNYPMSKQDSVYLAKRIKALPHNSKQEYTPPKGKQVSYTNF